MDSKINAEEVETFKDYIHKNLHKFSAKVEPIYKLLNWKWFDIGGYVIPCAGMIEGAIIFQLMPRLKEAIGQSEFSCSTGGIRLEIRKFSSGSVMYDFFMMIDGN